MRKEIKSNSRRFHLLVVGTLSAMLAGGRVRAWLGGQRSDSATGELRITPIEENGWFL